MNYDSLFQRYVNASGEEHLTARSLQVSLDAMCDYPQDIAPWLSELFTIEEQEYLTDYLLNLLGNGE